MINIVAPLILMIICISFSAFFSCSETALFSLSKSKLNILEEKGGKKGKLLSLHLSHATNLLITILIGNMFVNIFSTSLSERLAATIFSAYSLEIAIIAMTFIIMIFGEVTPKVIAVNHAQFIAQVVIPYIDIIYRFLTPIRRILYTMANGVVSGFSKLTGPELQSSYEDLKLMIADSYQTGILYKHEKKMIEGIIKLNTLQVKDIMTPRTEMVCFEMNDQPEKVFRAIKRDKFSRLPIFEKHLDNIIGILYTKDFLLMRGKNPNMLIKSVLREPYFVPETKCASDLFRDMRQNHTHLAVVVDEYGGVAGLVTMEDILEEIFGDILDKKDVLLSLKHLSPNSMKVSGRLTIKDFNEVFDTHLTDPVNTTLGGYLLSMLGRIPKKGECYLDGELEFIIALAKKNRIEDVIVTKHVHINEQGKKGK